MKAGSTGANRHGSPLCSRRFYGADVNRTAVMHTIRSTMTLPLSAALLFGANGAFMDVEATTVRQQGQPPLDTKLAIEIAGLQKLKTNALKARYRELFGEDSRSSNHGHLVRRIAWRLQALEFGDLSERARQRAAELAHDADLRLRPTVEVRQHLQGTDLRQVASVSDPRIPPVGRTLTRHYRGGTVQVTIMREGFEWNGRVYGSLSAIAWHATGTRWNGYAFFGLNNGQVERA